MCPHDALGAEIRLVGPTARPGEASAYSIVNTGSVPLICGLRYRLERETSDGWVVMNPGMAFRLIGFAVLPGQARELKASIPPDAPTGVYRIRVSVTSDHADGALDLTAAFEIRGND
jgi:hypothetical protein